MWIPTDEAGLRAAVEHGVLAETSQLDVKQALPPPGKNKDLAKDICAMTVEGGQLIYGVGGDDPTRPDRLTPIALEGVAERVDLVAQTAIAEPATVEISDFPAPEEPGRGYLVVHVPPS